MALGMTISWLNMSASSQTRSLDRQEPRKMNTRAVCLLFFAFSTILSWNFFGKINVNYLFGKKAVTVYSLLALVFIFLGSCLSNDLVWELADMFNQLMVIPNAIALVALSSLVAAAAKNTSKK